MKYSGSMMLAVPLAAMVITSSVACAKNDQNTASGDAAQQTGEQTAGSMPGDSMASMMEHMQQMHGRFQNMGEENYWMHGGGMMPGSQHMMTLSGDLGDMADAMRGAMGQMQSLMEQSGGEQSAYLRHLEQMQQHMQAMSDQLDQMSQTMEILPKGSDN